VHRDLMIEEAKKQAAAGSIIYLCWHMLRPTEDEPGQADPNGRMSESWRGSVQARLTDEQWLELITSDTPLHMRWEKYMDTAAGFLKQLQDAHIPVLWRPMHENNGTFFWWGGRSGQFGTAQLYRELYYRMVNVHHLNNLIWVWNQKRPGALRRVSPVLPRPELRGCGQLRQLPHAGRSVLLGGPGPGEREADRTGRGGNTASAEILKAQPKWVWFMDWAGGVERQADRLKTAYGDAWVLGRGDPLPK